MPERDWEEYEEAEERPESPTRREARDAPPPDLTPEDIARLRDDLQAEAREDARKLTEGRDSLPKSIEDLVGSRDYPVQGDANDIRNLASAFEQLESADAGKPIAESIREQGTTAKFGATDTGAIAQFDPATNEITIDEGQKDASSAVLAAHLAHEGTHVQWNKPDSVDQEYHAYNAEAEVWNALKGDESDKQCDWVSEHLIAKGEVEAKTIIRRMYPELPDD